MKRWRVYLINIHVRYLHVQCYRGRHGSDHMVVGFTFQQYFSYIVAVSFIGGGNRSTQRKPPTCRKSLINLSHNVVSNTPRHERGSNSQP
jgi:hypothetical protein